MLSGLILENFKAFGARQVLPLAPITLIFGANSAGKSSILQALLLLKQTVKAEAGDSVVLPRGDLVDLGSFRELVFQHDVARTCEITPLLDSQAGPDRSKSPLTQVLSNFVEPENWKNLEDLTRVTAGTVEELTSGLANPYGLGLRICYDNNRRAITLAELPVYCGDTTQPAYFLKSLTLPQKYPTSSIIRPLPTAIEVQSHFVHVNTVNENHTLWHRLFNVFAQRNVPATIRVLKTLVRDLEHLIADSPLSLQRKRKDADLYQWLSLVRVNTNDTNRLKSELDFLKNHLEKYSSCNISTFCEDLRIYNSSNVVGLRNLTLTNIEVPSWFFPKSRDQRLMNFLQERTFRYPPHLAAMSVMTASDLHRVLDRLVYLGPLRDRPDRFQVFSGVTTQEVGKTGHLLADLFFRREDLVEQTNKVLRRFDVGYQLRVNHLQDSDVADVFALRLVDARTNTLVSILDVGFGISQVLPIIVQSLLSERNIILIEQPELHLHPRLQAELGSLFAECISAPQQNQFIIETHSEHLILRLQRLIRQGALKPSDVSVLYATRDEAGSWCHQLRLDSEGDFIDEWPEGFFEEGYREMFAER